MEITSAEFSVNKSAEKMVTIVHNSYWFKLSKERSIAQLSVHINGSPSRVQEKPKIPSNPQRENISTKN